MNTTELKSLVESMVEDETKFAKGVNTAGTRLRQSLQKLKNLAQDIRVDILAKQKEKKNA